MEGNRDEAEKCVEIAREALNAGDREKAQRFLQKAEKLYPLPAARGEALGALPPLPSPPLPRPRPRQPALPPASPARAPRPPDPPGDTGRSTPTPLPPGPQPPGAGHWLGMGCRDSLAPAACEVPALS